VSEAEVLADPAILELDADVVFALFGLARKASTLRRFVGAGVLDRWSGRERGDK
jgi:hypothetical protein